MEKAIEERVHLTKFRRLEKNVNDYCRKEEFSEYKITMEETLIKIRDEFKPLERTADVNNKVRVVQNRFEKMSKTFSVKQDCAADKEEAMNLSKNLKDMVMEIGMAVDSIQHDVHIL